MREIQASEAKTPLPQLLDDVERGETILITRHGKPIARLVPETARRQGEITQAVANLRAMWRGGVNQLTLEEILASRTRAIHTDAVRARSVPGGQRATRKFERADTVSFLRNLAQLAIQIDRTPVEAVVLTLARQHRLSVYDGAYLELAQREGLMLATLDAALRQAAAAVGVPLLAEAA